MAVQHAYHQNLPQCYIDCGDGKSHLSKYVEKKARELLKLVDSIDLTAIDWNADGRRKGSGGSWERFGYLNRRGSEENGRCAIEETEEQVDEDGIGRMAIVGKELDDIDDPEGSEDFVSDDEEDDDHFVDGDLDVDQKKLKEKKKDSMATLVKKCARMNLHLSNILGSKHYILSQRDLSYMLMKVLMLVSASLKTTTTTTPINGKGDECDNARINAEVELQVEDVGFLLERLSDGTVVEHEFGEEMYKSVKTGTRKVVVSNENKVGDVDVNSQDYRSPFALPPPARDSLLSVAITLLSKSKRFLLLTASHLALPRHHGTTSYNSSSADSEDNRETVSSETSLPISIVLHWRFFSRMLLRTAPFLDEMGFGSNPSKASNSRNSSIMKKTVTLIRMCRCLFDQQGLVNARENGRLVPGRKEEDKERALVGGVKRVKLDELPLVDTSAREIWDMVRSDLLFRTHTNACFRAQVILYLFLPSRCSVEFYSDVMPEWLQSWSCIDHCNDFDSLWLQLFARGRKYTSSAQLFPLWHVIRRRLLSQCGSWLQIPVTGSSDDRSFPRTAPIRSRGVPSLLKSIVGSSSSYQEGLDFVEKLSTLLIFCVGMKDYDGQDKSEDGDATSGAVSAANVLRKPQQQQGNSAPTISDGTADILRFLSFVAPYFNPSNNGPWTWPLGALLHYLCLELSQRVGVEWGQHTLTSAHPEIAASIVKQDPYHANTLPHYEIVALLDALLPLCQQAIYSKNSYVGRAGESALVFLTQIVPTVISPPFLDFCTRALDVSSIHMSHQAPAALTLLQHLVQPSVRRCPRILLRRLPDILSLSLNGIDSNDQKKTLSTLSLYYSVAVWLPVGGGCGKMKDDDDVVMDCSCYDRSDGTLRLGTNLINSLSILENSHVFWHALSKLPANSLLSKEQQPCGYAISQPENEPYEDVDYETIYEEASYAMNDWSLSFLERIYGLLRAATQREKIGKSSSGGVASRHSSVDAQQARMFSRYLRSCLRDIFASMDVQAHGNALNSVCNFIKDETHPFASKDAASLCEAASAGGRGLDELMGVLTADMQSCSNKTAAYRLRCLAGTIRNCGSALLKHRIKLKSSLEFALLDNVENHDKHIFKTGCKLLRHLLASQVETYPLPSDCSPRAGQELGKSAQLSGGRVKWHIPSGEQINFALELLEEFAFSSIRELVEDAMEIETRKAGGIATTAAEADFADIKATGQDDEGIDTSSSLKSVVIRWRRSLKVLKYALRGLVGILLDDYNEKTISSCDENKNMNNDANDIPESELHPHEKAIKTILKPASSKTKSVLKGLRGKLCALFTSIMSLVAHETWDPSSDSSSSACSFLIDDTKICNEIVESSILLLTRRGAFCHVAQDKSAYHSLKEVTKDRVLSCQSNHIYVSLERAGYFDENVLHFYKDGEDGGKCLPRRLMITRVWLLVREIQHSASFAIPQMLRKRMLTNCVSNKKTLTRLFSPDANFTQVKKNILEYLDFDSPAQVKGINAMDGYEGLIDGLVALSCHTHVQVRGYALSALDSSLTRFGWLIRSRCPRLLQAIELRDDGNNDDMSSSSAVGLYGIPSCYQLSKQVDADGKRKRLSEVLKGVCSIVANPRTIRHISSTEVTRFQLIQTLCGSTQYLLSVLPTEEHLKILHFLQVIFSRFRSRWYALPRYSTQEGILHEECLSFLLAKLEQTAEKQWQLQQQPKQERQDQGDRRLTNISSTAVPCCHEETIKDETGGSVDKGSKTLPTTAATTSTSIIDSSSRKNSARRSSSSSVGSGVGNNSNDDSLMHWRNQLLVCWFLMQLLDDRDLRNTSSSELTDRIWTICFYIIENEMGQPLQRVALGLLGRLITFFDMEYQQQHKKRNSTIKCSTTSMIKIKAKDKLTNGQFCETLALALAYNHRPDSQVGGGHHAQWSAGVEDILRDASANCAPRKLFPFQRDSLNCGTFKVQHSQMLQTLLLHISDDNDDSGDEDEEAIMISAKHFLTTSEELAMAPPNEDQRNKQTTAWEIYAGVGRALLLHFNANHAKIRSVWTMLLLPFLERVLPSTPMEISRATYDSVRYIVQFSSSTAVYECLTDWLIRGIEKNLWQHSSQEATSSTLSSSKSLKEGRVAGVSLKVDVDESETVNTAETTSTPEIKLMNDEASNGNVAGGASPIPGGLDGFASQFKWLYLMIGVIVEMDLNESNLWYSLGKNKEDAIDRKGNEIKDDNFFELCESTMSSFHKSFFDSICTKLFPRLLHAIGHPYDKCRDYIAALLYRICQCHSKYMNFLKQAPIEIREKYLAISNDKADALPKNKSPGEEIIRMLSSRGLEEYTFKERQHSLITARKFIAYCVHVGNGQFEYSNFVIPLLPLVFGALKVSDDEGDEKDDDSSAAVVVGGSNDNNGAENGNSTDYGDDDKSEIISASDRALEAEVSKTFRYTLAEISSSCLVTYDRPSDINRVLNILRDTSTSPTWQTRQATANFLRCFQGCHKFLFSHSQTCETTDVVSTLLGDSRREVSNAAMAALTGILAVTEVEDVSALVQEQISIARVSIIKKKKKKKKKVATTVNTTAAGKKTLTTINDENITPAQKNGGGGDGGAGSSSATPPSIAEKEKKRSQNQQRSVYFLCACVLSRPYDTPPFVPQALTELSKHSFEKRASFVVRETIKKCFSEFKRTHMNDNWDIHRKEFTQEQLEALDDVVSTPHYYA